MFEPLYDVMESSKVNFIGYVSERARYDFAIVYTDSFFGKPLVVCMQTGRSTLLCDSDLNDAEQLQRTFLIKDDAEADELAQFLRQRLPGLSVSEQY